MGHVTNRPRPLGQRIGIMQGRLVPSASGVLDCSPGARMATGVPDRVHLRLNHIELVADRRVGFLQPPSGRARAGTRWWLWLEITGVDMTSMCLNESLSLPIDEIRRPIAEAPGASAGPVACSDRRPALARSKRSDPAGSPRRGPGRPAARPVICSQKDGSWYWSWVVSAGGESAVPGRGSARRKWGWVCYDIGNATAAGFDPVEELQLLDRAVCIFMPRTRARQRRTSASGTGQGSFRPGVRTALETGVRRSGHHGGQLRGQDPIATAVAHPGAAARHANGRGV